MREARSEKFCVKVRGRQVQSPTTPLPTCPTTQSRFRRHREISPPLDQHLELVMSHCNTSRGDRRAAGVRNLILHQSEPNGEPTSHLQSSADLPGNPFFPLVSGFILVPLHTGIYLNSGTVGILSGIKNASQFQCSLTQVFQLPSAFQRLGTL